MVLFSIIVFGEGFLGGCMCVVVIITDMSMLRMMS